MLSASSLSNVHDNFCAACWRDSNADPSLVWSWLLLLHAGGCHQVCHHSWLSSGCLKLSVVLRAVSALLYCRSGCMCCVIISSRLRSFRFCYRELEHSKARAAREKEVVNTWNDDQSSKVLIIFASFPIHREHLGRFEQRLVWCLHQHSWRVHGRWQVLTFLLCSVNGTFWMTSLIIFFGFVLKYAL